MCGGIEIELHKNIIFIKLHFKFKHILSRIYRIMLGEEDIPETVKTNKIMKRKTYMDKVLSVSIKKLNKDKTR